MAEARITDDDCDWSPWEQNIIKEIHERDQEPAYTVNNEAVIRKLFELFQHSAHCLAVLYKRKSFDLPSFASPFT